MESLVGMGHQKIMGLINVTSSPILQSHLLGLNSMSLQDEQFAGTGERGQIQVRTSTPGKGMRKPVSHDKAYV